MRFVPRRDSYLILIIADDAINPEVCQIYYLCVLALHFKDSRSVSLGRMEDGWAGEGGSGTLC